MTTPTSIDQAIITHNGIGLTAKLPHGKHTKVVELTVPAGKKYLVRSYAISPQNAHLFDGLNPENLESVRYHNFVLVELLEEGGATCLDIRYIPHPTLLS